MLAFWREREGGREKEKEKKGEREAEGRREERRKNSVCNLSNVTISN